MWHKRSTSMMQRTLGLLVAVVVAGGVVLAQAPGALRPGEVLQGDAARRIDDYLTRLVAHGFSGAVLVAADGNVVLKKAYGYANRATRQLYTVDMVSCIGSVSKQFTGAAIVKLEMMGKLKTSDPISTYLPGVPADKQGITIHHLLTHTAGFSGDQGGSDEEPIERDVLVARVLAQPLVRKPGEGFEYSNEGYSLAGAIIERVSGQGYEAFLREHLFLPADMAETGYLLPNWPMTQLPLGYGPQGGEWGRVYKNGWLPDGPGWWLRANGGIHSSLDDLYRWHLALESTKVLSADALKSYFTGHAPSMGTEMYAYGWGVQKTRRGTTAITHNGGNGFFFTDFRRYVDEKVVIIAMSNQPVIPATQLAPRQLESLYFNDAPVVIPPTGTPVPRAQRDALAGTYTSASGPIVVRATDDGLELEAADPTLFGTVSGLTPAGGRFADLEKQTMPILEAAAKGNFEPMIEAFRLEEPGRAVVVRGNQTRFWQEWRDQFGEFQGIDLLGTGNVQGDPGVTVRLRFARGGPVLQYIWGPRRLAGFREVPVEAVVLTAESPQNWAYFNYRLPQLIRLVFGSDGTLTITSAAGTITAKR
jgi:CubicO group peptidase (beta-lactamase class C family)